jgi:hypothetical protein
MIIHAFVPICHNLTLCHDKHKAYLPKSHWPCCVPPCTALEWPCSFPILSQLLKVSIITAQQLEIGPQKLVFELLELLMWLLLVAI